MLTMNASHYAIADWCQLLRVLSGVCCQNEAFDSGCEQACMKSVDLGLGRLVDSGGDRH